MSIEEEIASGGQKSKMRERERRFTLLLRKDRQTPPFPRKL